MPTKRSIAQPLCEHVHRIAESRANRLDDTSAADWIRYQGLLGLADSDRLRASVRTAVDRLRAANLVANTVRVWCFQDIVDALGKIPVCALKGIHLLDTVYRERQGDRTMYDVDLLVPPEHIDVAVNALSKELSFTESEVSRRVQRVHYHRCLTNGRIELELHSELGLQFWRRATWAELAPVPMTLHDRAVFGLDDATLLLHLLIHLVQHGPSLRLRWVEDIARLLDAGIDTSTLFDSARRFGVTVATVAGARLLRQLLDAALLPEIPDSLGRHTPWIVANERLVWSYPPERRLAPPRRSGRLRRNISSMLLSDSWLRALRYAGRKGLEVWLR